MIVKRQFERSNCLLLIPACMSKWAIYYDEQDQRFHKVKPSMIENIVIEVIDAEKGIYMIEKR